MTPQNEAIRLAIETLGRGKQHLFNPYQITDGLNKNLCRDRINEAIESLRPLLDQPEDKQRCNHCMTVQDEANTECENCGLDDALMYPFEPADKDDRLALAEMPPHDFEWDSQVGSWYQEHYETIKRALSAPADRAGKYALGQRVTKIKGSSWQGRVVGFYSTELTPIGYCIESEREPGSVQIYPESAIISMAEKEGEE